MAASERSLERRPIEPVPHLVRKVKRRHGYPAAGRPGRRRESASLNSAPVLWAILARWSGCAQPPSTLQARGSEPRPEEKRGPDREEGEQPGLAAADYVVHQRAYCAARALVAHVLDVRWTVATH